MRRVLTRQDRHPGGAPDPAVDWRGTLKHRTIVTVVLLAVWAAGIEGRLVALQVFERADLAARAARQQLQTIAAPARRGDILDRSGRVLATSADSDSIYAVPAEIDDEAATVGKLCGVFGDCTVKERQTLVDRLGKQRAFAYVRRQVSPDVARQIAELDLPGIGSLKESQRFYPNRELAAHLLGWVGVDNTGLGGIEAAYDSQIHGRDGKVLLQADARRQAFNRLEKSPVPGGSIELTIDEYLQHVAERELHAGVVENHAAGGSAIIMNPHTGEILAMANEPTFNPNAYRDSQELERRNRAVQDLYEPGSTFKVVTVSAALEEKVMTPDTLIDTNPGSIQIGTVHPRVIRENENHNYGVLSLSKVIAWSSNVGAIKIGFKVGTDRLSRYVSLYGFGHPISPDFPSESPGIVWSPEKWTDSALASVSMGYQVGVTPLQMVAAVSAVANGGAYVEPRVLRALYRDNRRYAVQPKILRRAIDADTAATMTGIMEGVVEDERGTARSARMPGYTIAGKTGTAAKLVNGHYSHTEYNASFVGFIPSRNPAVSIIVVIDSPHGPNRYFGGTVSAPIFKRIAEATLRYLGVGPSINPPPPVLVTREPEGSPLPTATNGSGSVVGLVSDDSPGTVPDVRGLSARDAVRKLARFGLTPEILGNGLVVSQDPQPGEEVDPGSTCVLKLGRVAPDVVASAQP